MTKKKKHRVPPKKYAPPGWKKKYNFPVTTTRADGSVSVEVVPPPWETDYKARRR